MTKVAINGFGRIGRLVARAILERPDCGLELVAINDLGDAKSNAMLFKRDSVHGPYPGEVSADGDDLIIDGKRIKVTAERDPAKLLFAGGVRISDTEAEAREKIQAQIREAQEMRTQLMAEATQKADQFLKRAQEDIARDKEQALTEIRQKVVTLSLQATEKLLQDNVDNERNRKLVDDFLAKVEVPR